MQVFVRSKICPDPCKWGYSYSIQNQKLDLFSTFYNHQAGFLKTSAETTSKVADTEKKKNWANRAAIAPLSFSPFLV